MVGPGAIQAKHVPGFRRRLWPCIQSLSPNPQPLLMLPQQLGPYRIVRRLGRGGMGTVYEGVNVETGESAAVKVLSGELQHEPDFRNRFAAEIEALRRLDHPNIVRLFGFGEQEGQLFYAMELVAGVSIEDQIRDGRRFTWREVIQIGSQTCLALRHAHDCGIIHRDIKPANLLLTADDQLKLSDFGIARLFGNSRMTMVGSVIGTVEYMAPEQADGKPVDPRTDLYCLGGVFYAMLAGRPPFVAQTLHEMLQKQRHEQPEPLGQLVADVPEYLAVLVMQLLEKDPSRRVSNAMLLGRRLDVIAIGMARISSGARGDAAKQAGVADDVEPSRPSAEDVSKRPDPTGLAVTRVMDDADATPVVKAAPSLPPTRELRPGADPSATVAAPPASVVADATGISLLPMEEATGNRSVSPSDGTAAIPPGATVQQKPSTQFVTVGDDERGRIHADDRPASHWLQTGALVAALLMIGLTMWYFLQPPTADALYDRIMEKTADGTTDSIVSVKKEIAEFLIRYSEDSRAKKIREFDRTIELDRLERQFDRRVGQLEIDSRLLPVERAYLEALNYARLDPALGARKLRALIELYGDHLHDSGPTGKCLELARGRLETLDKEMQRAAADHVAVLEKRFQEVETLRQTDPEKARVLFEAIIELYGTKPWAAHVVERARKAAAEPIPTSNRPPGNKP
jgi:eukaryotic-like serine/threonine-protein kinase